MWADAPPTWLVDVTTVILSREKLHLVCIVESDVTISRRMGAIEAFLTEFQSACRDHDGTALLRLIELNGSKSLALKSELQFLVSIFQHC